jgi:gliding motility-associated-like protein
VNPNPSFSLFNVTTDQTINFGNSVQLNAFGAVIYYWTPNDGSLSNPNINNPVATPPVPTTYTVYGYNSDGCLDTASVHIDVIYNDSDFVPSGFTPNGDGQNDVFRIMHLKHDKLVEFNVYNRWGQLIFQTADLNKGWDGTFMNVPQDMGVYNYMITTSNSSGANKTYKGTVTLIR